MRRPGKKFESNALDLASDEHIENGIRLTTARRKMFADLIEIRQNRGISQDQVASAIGIHKSGVSKFESQRELNNPTLDVVLRYAHAVGAMMSVRVEPVERWEHRQAVLAKFTQKFDSWSETAEQLKDNTAVRPDTHWLPQTSMRFGPELLARR